MKEQSKQQQQTHIYQKFNELIFKLKEKTTVDDIISMFHEFLEFLYELKKIEESNNECNLKKRQ